MFDSLNDEIRRTEGPAESTLLRLLRYAGVSLAAIVFVWALYAGILLLEG
jgi:hypothetical protein